jgi:type I restriction enzyme S subunit
MGGEWRETQLGDVADLLTGFPFKSEHYTTDPNDPRLVGGDNIAQGWLRWDNASTTA